MGAGIATRIRKCFSLWGGRWESNPQRPEPQSGALPVELLPPCPINYNNQARARRLGPPPVQSETIQIGRNEAEMKKTPMVKRRCSWASSEAMIPYHDSEWGLPQHDDRV